MLMNGYANAKCWFSFKNLQLLNSWLCNEVWVIVGNEDPNAVPHS